MASALSYEELAVLDERKGILQKEHEEYIESHPELKTLLSSFMCAVFMEKPTDVVEFSRRHFSALQPQNDLLPEPLVIAGPSGVGKGTLISKLLENFPDQFGFSVSHTTRDPRVGEVQGESYFFTTKDKMSREIETGVFLEHADVHGNMYGTSCQAVKQIQKQGKICILDIDVQGVEQVKNQDKIVFKYLFVAPPSIEQLETRLRGRGTENENKIILRTQNAKAEMEYSRKPKAFDRILVNADFDTAYIELEEQIKRWYPSVFMQN